MIKYARGAAVCAVLVVAAVGPAWGQKAADIINMADPAAVEAQLKGNFGTIDRKPSLPLGAVQEAWKKADSKAGVYTVGYSPDEIVRLRVREKMPVTIVLPEWEEIGPVANGDPFVFSYQQIQKNMLVVEAAHVGADASLTIVGKYSRRIYAFYLRAEGFNSAEIPDIVVYVKAAAPSGTNGVRVAMPDQPIPSTEYPPGEAEKGTRAEQAAGKGRPLPARESSLKDPDYLREVPADPERLQFGFTMSGDRSIAPERVFSDGVFTYFDFGSRWVGTDLPAVWRVVDGIDTPQNSRVRGTMVIAEATGAFTLRNGQRVVCVRPEGWEPTAKPKRAPKPVAQRQPATPEPARHEGG